MRGSGHPTAARRLAGRPPSANNRRDFRQRTEPSEDHSSDWERSPQRSLAAEYVSRVSRLTPLVPHLPQLRARPLPLAPHARPAPLTPPPPPLPLAAELARSLLLDGSLDDALDGPAPDSLWNGKPQQYFESINCERDADDYDSDSLAP